MENIEGIVTVGATLKNMQTMINSLAAKLGLDKKEDEGLLHRWGDVDVESEKRKIDAMIHSMREPIDAFTKWSLAQQDPADELKYLNVLKETSRVQKQCEETQKGLSDCRLLLESHSLSMKRGHLLHSLKTLCEVSGVSFYSSDVPKSAAAFDEEPAAMIYLSTFMIEIFINEEGTVTRAKYTRTMGDEEYLPPACVDDELLATLGARHMVSLMRHKFVCLAATDAACREESPERIRALISKTEDFLLSHAGSSPMIGLGLTIRKCEGVEISFATSSPTSVIAPFSYVGTLVLESDKGGGGGGGEGEVKLREVLMIDPPLVVTWSTLKKLKMCEESESVWAGSSFSQILSKSFKLSFQLFSDFPANSCPQPTNDRTIRARGKKIQFFSSLAHPNMKGWRVSRIPTTVGLELVLQELRRAIVLSDLVLSCSLPLPSPFAAPPGTTNFEEYERTELEREEQERKDLLHPFKRCRRENNSNNNNNISINNGENGENGGGEERKRRVEVVIDPPSQIVLHVSMEDDASHISTLVVKVNEGGKISVEGGGGVMQPRFNVEKFTEMLNECRNIPLALSYVM